MSLFGFTAYRYINLRRLTHRRPMRILCLNHVLIWFYSRSLYTLETTDTQASNENLLFKSCPYLVYTLCSYWLSCCTGPFDGISRHSLYKFGSNGPLASLPPSSHPPRVPPYSSMTSGFQFTGYWYSLFPWAPNFSIQIMGVKSPERSKGNSLQSKNRGSYYPHSYPYISWGIHQIPVGHLG